MPPPPLYKLYFDIIHLILASQEYFVTVIHIYLFKKMKMQSKGKDYISRHFRLDAVKYIINTEVYTEIREKPGRNKELLITHTNRALRTQTISCLHACLPPELASHFGLGHSSDKKSHPYVLTQGQDTKHTQLQWHKRADVNFMTAAAAGRTTLPQISSVRRVAG